jgi:hypothetical protein
MTYMIEYIQPSVHPLTLTSLSYLLFKVKPCKDSLNHV